MIEFPGGELAAGTPHRGSADWMFEYSIRPQHSLAYFAKRRSIRSCILNGNPSIFLPSSNCIFELFLFYWNNLPKRALSPRFNTRTSQNSLSGGDMTMKAIFAAAIIVAAGVAIVPAAANAQERLKDGAMGAVAGALVLGPIGLVAGGVIGYTNGPNIARGMNVRDRRHHHVHYSDRYDDRASEAHPSAVR
jgi:hypothetical protein